MRHQPQDPERHDAGPRRRVVAEDHAAERAGHPQPRVARTSAVRPLPQWTISMAMPVSADQPLDVGVGHRGRAAVDVADDVGPRLEDRVRADRRGPRQRRAAGVERRDHAVRARPGDHRRGLGAGLDRSEPDLADEPHAAGRHLGEVGFDQPQLEDRRAGADLHAARSERRIRREPPRSRAPSARRRPSAARGGAPRRPRSSSSRRRAAPTR